MIWRSTVLILVAFITSGLAVWFGPELLATVGLGEFAVVGQVGFAVVVLSGLELAFGRLAGGLTDHENGPAEPPPSDR